MDVIEEDMPWLDEVMTEAGNEGLDFPDERGGEIAAEIAREWGKGDRLAFVRGCMGRWGREAALSTFERIAQFHNQRYWAMLARKSGDVSFESYRKLLWDPLVPPDFEYGCQRVGSEVRYRVTRCPHADAARRAGGDAGEIFYRLVCSCDPVSVRAFNPIIGFRRTVTLMEGDSCDHTYIVPGD